MYGEETAPRHEYDYNAKGQVARVRDNLLNRTTQSEYDLANRPVRVKTSEDAKHVYTGQVAYDNVYGNLSEFTEKVGENRQEYGTKFGYDDENRPTSLTYSASGKKIGQSTTTIDKLNRTTFSAVKLGSKTFTSEYHFAAGGYGTGSVTNLVASITQPGCNCGYGYDDNGNIASATLNGKWTGYTYDALGQLIQVNDHSDTRAGDNGSTWVYEYDRGGNILGKKLYPYANTSGEPLQTMRFTYDNANWKDQLTAVDGVTITYDAIGNPLNDGTWTYTWENGRQLKQMQSVDTTATFVYNENGLRVQKTVNGVVTKYTLHSKNVVHMTQGSNNLHFFYDAQNKPAVVVYNDIPYSYVKNLQGDIVAILDSTGTAVVNYVYDAWGRPISKTGSMAGTLGTVQPFRYRGYVYDEETGLYYLRSRYYNPNLGRFVNADRVFDANASVTTYNQYAYCDNCPVIYLDSEGRGLFTSLVIGFVVGALVSGIIEAAKGGDVEDIIISAVAGGVSGLISVIPVFRNPYINSAIMGGVGNAVGAWIGGDIDSIYDVIDNFAEGAAAGVVGQFVGDQLLNWNDKYWKQLSRDAKKHIISNLGNVDQAQINEVYKAIRAGVNQNTLHQLIKEYGIDVVLSVFVSTTATCVD